MAFVLNDAPIDSQSYCEARLYDGSMTGCRVGFVLEQINDVASSDLLGYSFILLLNFRLLRNFVSVTNL